MKFVARLVRGDIALWRTFWLIGTPLALVWDLSGLSMLAGYGVGEPAIAGFIVAVFTLSSAALPSVAVAIWRSASQYPREAWWQSPLAIGAKLCAAISGLVAGLSFLTVLYLAFSFIYAAVVRA